MGAFGPSFHFGSATSAHQVEGGTDNDWTAWERQHAVRAARRWERGARRPGDPAARRVSDRIRDAVRPDAADPARYISGIAADHLHRYPDDLRTAAGLGLDAYRFSVEWSRVEPEPGRYDGAWLDHYAEMASCSKRLGQEPFVTLWHFTFPRWAAAAGGWRSPEVVERFGGFARVVTAALRGSTRWIATLNEPEVHVAKSYLTRVWPPGGRFDPRAWTAVRRGMVAAHQVAARAVRSVDDSIAVGFCTSQNPVVTQRPSWQPLAGSLDDRLNGYFTGRLAPSCDWLGVQYYIPVRLGRDPGCSRSDLGWPLAPQEHATALRSLARHGIPLVVTESGLADTLDRHRGWYIEESLKSIAQALQDGVDCRGYLHWSLLDNHEWAEGAWPRFGLLAVDRDTLERRPRPSALHYRDLIAAIRAQSRNG